MISYEFSLPWEEPASPASRARSTRWLSPTGSPSPSSRPSALLILLFILEHFYLTFIKAIPSMRFWEGHQLARFWLISEVFREVKASSRVIRQSSWPK